MAHSDPYLSVVVTSRNDDHGQSLLRRMQTFVNALIGQCKRHGLRAELVLVEWNPPADRPRFIEALRWPEKTGPCQVRIIEVPAELHRRFKHSDNLPLFQMIAKNVGIRRARGRFIVATNIDILLSDALVRALARGELQRGRMYRIDRHDVMTDVPVHADVAEQLEYCETHLLRINCRQGTFELTPDGRRTVGPEDIATVEMGARFENGWYPVERWNGEVYRWVGQDAVLAVSVPAGPARALCLEVEPGPGVRSGPFELQVRDPNGQIVARGFVQCRQMIHLTMPLRAGQSERLQLHTVGGGLPISFDPRILNFRVMRCWWSENTPALVDDAPSPEVFNFRADDAYVLAKEDIATAEMGLRFGRGWHGFERWNGEPFRWVGNDAGIAITLPSAVARVLSLEVEPGPGVNHRPFGLQVRDSFGQTVARGFIQGRQVVYLTLPLSPGQTKHFEFHSEGGGRPIANSPRILNFRVLRCGWVDGAQIRAAEAPAAGTFNFQPGDVFQLAKEDIAPADMGLRFGRGWYAVERNNGVLSRWVGEDARIAVDAPAGPAQILSLELQPGPGVDNRPFTLQVQDLGGRTVAQGVVSGHAVVHLLLPLRPGQTEQYRLRVPDGDRRIATDPRTLNFNVLRCYWSKNWPKRNALAQPDDAYNFKTEEVYVLAAEDIAPAAMGLRLGHGWYAVERNHGALSRWVGDDAGIAIATPAGPARILSLEVQPGPGVDYRSFTLRVRDLGGRTVAQGVVDGPRVVHLLLPLRPGQSERFSLHVEGGGKRIATDPRILNFQVSRCYWSPSWEAIPLADETTEAFHFKTEEPFVLAEEDIAPVEMGLRFGRGWYPVERNHAGLYRWVGEDAALAVDASGGPARVLSLELQPGPGVDDGPFTLQVLDASGQTVAQGVVNGRKVVHLLLRTGREQTERFWLRALEGGRRIRTDPRILNFDVFRCSWSEDWEGLGDRSESVDAFNFKTEDPYVRAAEDIAAAETGLRFGPGWHAVERNHGALSRWVGEKASFSVDAPPGPVRALNLEVAPGPGVDYRPFVLQVRDVDGQSVAQVAVEGRKVIQLLLPLRAGKTDRFWFQVKDGGHQTANDPRIMNFAVFRCYWSQEYPRGEALESHPYRADDACVLEEDDFAPQHMGLRFGRGWQADGATIAVTPPRDLDGGWSKNGNGAGAGSHLARAVWPEAADASVPAPQDIALAEMGLHFGPGWGAPEHENGESYRWVENDAWFTIEEASDAPVKTLSFDLELCPELANRRVELQVRDPNGRIMAQESVQGRRVAHLMLRVRPGRTEPFQLHVEAGGDQASDEPHTPVVRIFRCGWSKPGDSVPDNEIVSPLPLHTCACGDFTLLSREDWFELLGYPEFEMFSLHIDSVFCYLAHHHGVVEEMLEDPMRIYHIEHGTGSGWTPEGAAKLMERIADKGISCLECLEVLAWATEMRRLNRPLVLNYEDWGLPGEQLPETIVGGTSG